jgi:phosphomannomutase
MLSVSGCRGIVGSSLTAEVAARFAGSFGSWLRERAERAGQPKVLVVIGRDGRAGGQMVQHAAIAGLIGAGCDVVDLGIAMTPTVAIMTDEYARRAHLRNERTAVAGMVLTASHNPQVWNGLKCLLAEGHELPGAFLSAACAPPAEFANEIIGRFKDAADPVGARWDHIGTLFDASDSGDVHIDRLLAALQNAGLGTSEADGGGSGAGGIGVGLRVALDSVNGSGAIIARDALEALGCDEILHLGKDTTGIFSHAPEPTAQNLSVEGGLCDAVREGGLDVGFAQDPDADRLAIIDETGRYIGEEYTLALSAMAVLQAAKASGLTSPASNGKAWTLVTNLSTSRMLDDVAAMYGAKVLRTAVGEANVVATMKREGAILGGEGNGGTIWPRTTYVRDSLTSMALVLWLMSPAGAGKGTKRKLSDIVKTMPSYAIEKRKIDLARKEDAAPFLEKIANAYKSERVDRQDGVWIDFASKRAWLHVRASNTEPIMRLIAEAPTQALANELLDHAMTLSR